MNKRILQGMEKRERIVRAAIVAFADLGFAGASTTQIAKAAGVSQGLLTYHFDSKKALWYAAADDLFARIAAFSESDSDTGGRRRTRGSSEAFIRQFVRFSGKHPELNRFMCQENKNPDGRLEWLVDKHIKPAFRSFKINFRDIEPELLPHYFYFMIGGGSMIFTVPEECKRATGLDPLSDEAIERHADFVVSMLLPEKPNATAKKTSVASSK